MPLPWGTPGNCLDMMLDRGATYRVVCHDASQKNSLLETLEQRDGVTIVSQNGGLLNHLSMRENLCLPSIYRGKSESEAKLEQDTTDMLRHCGLEMAPNALTDWLNVSPSTLGKLERRLAGFVRALLSYPEILVFEGVFEGLTRLEAARALEWREIFHSYYPFRTVLFIDLDFQGLPALDDCVTCNAPLPH